MCSVRIGRVGNRKSGRWGPDRQASPPPARHRPGARSARRPRCRFPWRADPSERRFLMWLRSLFGSKPVQHRKPKAVRRRVSLAVEMLEERVVPYRTFGGDAVWGHTDLSYSYSNLLDGGIRGLSTDDLWVATREAMGVWAAVTPLTFTERPDSGPPPSDDEY